MSDLWGEPTKEQEEQIEFAQCHFGRTFHPTDRGGYYKTFIQLTPAEGGAQIIERTYVSFAQDWNEVVWPSIVQLMQDGKLPKDAAELEYQYFISYRWTDYHSLRKDDIDYWMEKDSSRLGKDDMGRTYAIKSALEFLDVFATETEYQNAAMAKQADPVAEAVLETLHTIVGVCGTDMAKLQERLGHPPLDRFEITGPEVKQSVAAYVAEQAGKSIEAQEKLLAEINSHFNSEVPYLTIGSSELVRELDEVAF